VPTNRAWAQSCTWSSRCSQGYNINGHMHTTSTVTWTPDVWMTIYNGCLYFSPSIVKFKGSWKLFFPQKIEMDGPIHGSACISTTMTPPEAPPPPRCYRRRQPFTRLLSIPSWWHASARKPPLQANNTRRPPSLLSSHGHAATALQK
jgi:hypothetical protein